jgi:general secretion pathway protein A
MSESYLRHFGLSKPPFAKEVADAELWLPPSKQGIVDEVIESIEARESISIVGEPGVGKTCVLRAVRHRLPTETFRLTYCHNATLGRRDFYRQLCLAMGLSPSATAAAVFYAVSTHVQDLGRDKVHPVFLLDEAHMLHHDTFGHLHILLNYEWDSRALLSLVLVGLPELRDRLEMRRNRSLYSRLQRRLVIEPTTPDDTAEYLRFRLKLAGTEKEIFTSDAITVLHEAALGALRGLDRVTTGALRIAARRKRKLVERDVVTDAIALDNPSPQ